MLPTRKHITLAFAALCLSACEPGGKHNHNHDHDDTHNHKKTENHTKADSVDESKIAQEKSQNISSSNDDQSSIDSIITLFDEESFVSEPKVVDCTLSGGTKTNCISITLKPQPGTMKIGPWCPRNISDSAEKSGIWLENGKVHDVDGAFISNLAEFYKDDIWQMFDEETGKVNVTDSKVSCAAAARPDVDEQYTNFCVECQVSYMDDHASTTYVIPIKPTNASSPSTNTRSGIGVAFSGARIDSSAPTHAILAAHTLAPFDDCGGHVNLHVGYHLHAITDSTNCLKDVSYEPNHAPAIGVAMDGYSIHRQSAENSDKLDSCGGHDSASLGYHYHAAEPGLNKILACHTGETGCSSSDSDSECDASAQTDRRGGPPPNQSNSDKQSTETIVKDETNTKRPQERPSGDRPPPPNGKGPRR